MPYADPEKKKQQVKRWREDAIKNGYGKALYRRRAARYRNEEILREAVEYLLSTCEERLKVAKLLGKKRNEISDLNYVIKSCKDMLKNAPEVGPPSNYMP